MPLFSNYYPATYQPTMYQSYQQPQVPQQGGIQWVQGETGAKAFNVLAGQSVLLMDSENNVFYIKSTDTSGMPQPLRIFDYKERMPQNEAQNSQTAAIDTSLFVTREELESRLSELLGANNATSNTISGNGDVNNGKYCNAGA